MLYRPWPACCSPFLALNPQCVLTLCPKHHHYMAFISQTSWGQYPTVQSVFHSPPSEVDFQLNTDISVNQDLRMVLFTYFYWILDIVFSLLFSRKWPLWKQQASRVRVGKFLFSGVYPWHTCLSCIFTYPTLALRCGILHTNQDWLWEKVAVYETF